MLIEKRPNQKSGGRCEFYWADELVEARLLGSNGEPDAQFDGRHAFLAVYPKEQSEVTTPSLARTSEGVTIFAPRVALIDWGTVPEGKARIYFLNDEEVLQHAKEMKDSNPKAFEQLQRLPWSGQEICQNA